MHINDYLSVSCEAAIKAGSIIMEIYENEEVIIRTKDDKSPVTQADIKSSDLICKILKTTGLPVITEEISAPDYETRKNWHSFWLVDPLDGTKEFIKHNGEFSVNIALIEKNIPVLGVIYIPAQKILYFGIKDLGNWKKENIDPVFDVLEIIKNEKPLECKQESGKPRIITSRSHLSEQTCHFIKKMEKKYGDVEIIKSGSAVKFCLIAEGKADIYPRFGPTMEWDTAAGHVFAMNSGIEVRTLNGHTLLYNKPNLMNPDFVVYQPHKLSFDSIFYF
jgi:3'(2'), 5'-bisphosphate nucleotidase